MSLVFDNSYIDGNEILFFAYIFMIILIIILTIIFTFKEIKK